MSSLNTLNRLTLGNIIYHVATFLFTWGILLLWGLASWALRRLTFVVTSHQTSQLEEQFHTRCFVPRRRLWILWRCQATNYKLKEELTGFLSAWALVFTVRSDASEIPLNLCILRKTLQSRITSSEPRFHFLSDAGKIHPLHPFQFLIATRLGMPPCLFASYNINPRLFFQIITINERGWINSAFVISFTLSFTLEKFIKTQGKCLNGEMLSWKAWVTECVLSSLIWNRAWLHISVNPNT